MQTTLGERLRIARERADLTQDQLGERLGAGRNAVGAWEKDERLPEGRFLLQLPEVLRVSADWLLLGRAGEGAPSLPREALEALRDWMDQTLPPKEERRGGGGNADSA